MYSEQNCPSPLGHDTLLPKCQASTGSLTVPWASTTIIQLLSSQDPYEAPRYNHIDYDDYYLSDIGYDTHSYKQRNHLNIDI